MITGESPVIPAVREVLETMYFMSPEYCGEGQPLRDSYHIGVDFSGDRNGRFLISVCRSLARRMAADFLVADVESVQPSLVEATVFELANVACGAALSASSPDQAFVFSVPFAVAGHEAARGQHSFSVFEPYPEISFALLFH